VTPEVVLVAPIPLISTGTDANVQIRGVSKNVLQIRNKVKIVEGRMFQPGLNEVVVGKNANKSYFGLTLGNTISLGNVRWLIVGIFDAGGSAFDSEVWADAHLLGPAYNRPDTFFQSVTVHLVSPDSLQQFKDSVTSDPRLNVDVTREIDYYSKQSTRLTTLITVLGGLIAAIMAIGFDSVEVFANELRVEHTKPEPAGGRPQESRRILPVDPNQQHAVAEISLDRHTLQLRRQFDRSLEAIVGNFHVQLLAAFFQSAIAAAAHSTKFTGRLKCWRPAAASSRPVTTPNLMARLCSNMAIKVDIMMTESRV